MRIRLFGDFLVIVANASKPTVGLILSRRTVLPVFTSPESKASTASFKSASRNAPSRLARFWMVSLKSLVSGISILLFFTSLIFDPQGLGAPYILLLSLLSSAAEQDRHTGTHRLL